MPRKQASTKQRALEILTRLKLLYPDATCSLDYKTPVQLLVATILSAQCTDVRVNQVTPLLFGRFPDARTRPPLLFQGALETRIWVLIDRPDTDPSHRETIDRMLAAIDLDWNRAALVSRLPWPTPGDGEPTASALARFSPVVERLAELAPPTHVLALGQVAADLAGTQARLGSSRGRWFDWRGAQLLPSIHPRAMDGTKELKRQAFEHLKLFRAAIG